MDLKNFQLAPLYAIDQEWALLTAGVKEKFNTMTISWGGLGTIWNKPVVTVYVKPIRYTYEFMESNEYFTISFYDEKYKRDLGILGSKSGRNLDKVALTKLTPEFLENTTSFKEAKLTIVCKKIYFQDLDINNIDTNSIPQSEVDRFYKEEPMHRMYIGEVVDIIDRRIWKLEQGVFDMNEKEISIKSTDEIVLNALISKVSDNKKKMKKYHIKYH